MITSFSVTLNGIREEPFRPERGNTKEILSIHIFLLFEMIIMVDIVTLWRCIEI